MADRPVRPGLVRAMFKEIGTIEADKICSRNLSEIDDGCLTAIVRDGMVYGKDVIEKRRRGGHTTLGSLRLFM